jgi:hypothetical protein
LLFERRPKLFGRESPQFARNRYEFSQLTMHHGGLALGEQCGDSVV